MDFGRTGSGMSDSTIAVIQAPEEIRKMWVFKDAKSLSLSPSCPTPREGECWHQGGLWLQPCADIFFDLGKLACSMQTTTTQQN